MATRLLAVLGLALALVLGGCTYEREEPGLFRVRPSPSASVSEDPAPDEPSAPPPPAAPAVALPVAGELVWTSGEGEQVTVRLAVHAVRRIPGATVLDWSVTPLSAPGRVTGDELPGTTDLGLAQQGQADLAIWLLDRPAERAYRTLTHRSRRTFNHCLCSPVWAAQAEFRLGSTRLLQAVFPPLPATTRSVDVQLANQAAVVHVPVTPVGQVPTARARADLTRPPDAPGRSSRAVTFGYPGDAQDTWSATVDRVVADTDGTSLEWTLRSLHDQSGFRRRPLGPPVSAPVAADVVVTSDSPASGPRLRAGGRELATSWITDRSVGQPAYACLCSNLNLWARSLRDRDGVAHVAGRYPALPSGTRTVEVVLPGVAVLRVPVTRAPDAARRLGPPTAATVRTWVYSDRVPPLGWSVDDWPTPLPDEWQLPEYEATVETITTLPTP